MGVRVELERGAGDTHRANVSLDKLEIHEARDGLEVVEVGAVVELVHHHHLRKK